MQRPSLKRSLVALAIATGLCLGQETWALAGTTGGIAGYVRETSGAPVADATLHAVSPSGTATSTTDAHGHFNFLSLSPDTYTITVSKEGFTDESVPGVVVFADQTQTLNITQDKKLTTIARVRSVSAGALVKSGVTADQYSVDSKTIDKAAALGGGGNLDNAYSAIASVPGVNVPIGGMGWNQPVYIRGSQAFFTSYEYDGVPVNRAFDNYNSSTESNLGLQELQVYTGGGPASNSSSGTSGFINQVIKTGTYPGYAEFTGGLGANAFYHMAKIEAGGASPDRNFSYYVGVNGTNQAFRFLNNQNGSNLMGPGGIYSLYSAANDGLGYNTPITGGALPQCNTQTGATPGTVTAILPATFQGGTSFCLDPYFGYSGNTSFITDRENVVNFHFGIPRKNGQRDDLQVLWSGSSLKTFFYGTPNDIGGTNNSTYNLNAYMVAQDGLPYIAPTDSNVPPYDLNGLYTGTGHVGCYVAGSCNYPYYADAYVYNQGFGTSVVGSTPGFYQYPDSPSNRQAFAQLPSNIQDSIWNDTGIVKLQYTHPLSDRAYLRLAGYTFYSDWNQTGPLSTPANYLFGWPNQALAANYLLSTHTTGGEFQFSDQVNDKNLVSFTANYTRANVVRDNNAGFAAGGTLGRTSPFGLVANGPGGYTCYNPASGNPMACSGVLSGGYASQYSATAVALGDFTFPAAVPGAAAAAGAQYINLWDGPTKGAYNSVKPQFTTLSLTDNFRPNDKWLFNGGLRYEQYAYGLDPSTSPANQFYGQIVQNYSCYNTVTKTVFEAPLLPGQFPPASPTYETGDCNTAIGAALGTAQTNWVHPNGTTQDGVAAPLWSNNSPSSYNLKYYSVRLAGTYTESPDTVWRFEGGRYIEPPISASVQYLDQSGNNSTSWAGFMNLGFFSPFHPIPSQTSGQYDVSLERHIRGTDVSFKISPFYNLTNGYQEQAFIGPGFVTQVPVGQFRSMGVEGQITKGDFNRNGLSGQLSLTYTKAQVRYQDGLANNQVNLVNGVITQFNALTKAGGGSPCYTPAVAATSTVGAPTACGLGMIANPYYNMNTQSTLDPNGWYAPAGIYTSPGYVTSFEFYDSPWVSSLILNYRHDKFAVTPSVQFASGSSYGSPFDTTGADPRECQSVDSSATNPNQCNYLSLIAGGATPSGVLYVPNWQTGSFASIGQFRNPNLLTGNLALTYDVNPRITARVTLTNIFHTCFGGTKAPWTSAYAPGANVCAYGANGTYVSNYQLGDGAANPANTSAYNSAANGTTLYPWQQQSYSPSNGSFAGFIPAPFNAYFNLEVKL